MKSLDTFEPHEINLAATEQRRVTVCSAQGDFVSTLVYDIYEGKGVYGGRKNVLIDVDLFESMVAELNRYRHVLAPVSLPDPITP